VVASSVVMLATVWQAAVGALLFCACVPEGPPDGRNSDALPGTSLPTETLPHAIRSRLRRGPRKRTDVIEGFETRPPSNAGASDSPLTTPWKDDFSRSSLGPDWRATSTAWKLDAGWVCAKSARNHPLWLKRRLPQNARIEFTAVSRSSDGDLKAEAWGDGYSAAVSASYEQASSYIFILGGWTNRFHVLARRNEHARDRLSIAVDSGSRDPRARPVVAQMPYRFRLERTDGKTIRVWVNGTEMFTMSDPDPMSGPGHDHFAFNEWESPTCFDDLVVTPLPD